MSFGEEDIINSLGYNNQKGTSNNFKIEIFQKGKHNMRIFDGLVEMKDVI